MNVAATSTTSGADLLVSGTSSDNTARVVKSQLTHPDVDATTLHAVMLGEVSATAGTAHNVLAGD